MKKLYMLLTIATAMFASNYKLAKIDNIYSKSEPNNISICAKVNRYFDEYNGNKLKPYISIIPKDEFSVSVSYKRFCVDNLKPSTNYSIFISKNIPLSNNLRLDKDYSKELKTTNYAPSFNFKESGYILPKKGEISIPIEGINVNKLAVSLYRINTNNLINAINQYGFVRALEYYDLEKIKEQSGYMLWEKRVRLKPILNKKKIYAIDVGKYLKNPKSGVYILAVSLIRKDGTVNYYSTKTQWFMISDIGLFSLEDDKALHIYTRKLSDASLYNDIKLELRAKNNEILATTTTKNAKAQFKKSLLLGKGGLKAKAIYAYSKNGDFSVLDLSRSPYNLSDRGVGGRIPPKYYDTFIYTNRGIFKPNSTILFNAIVKKLNGLSASNLKISANLKFADGKTVATKLLTTDKFGFCHSSFKIPKSAKRGRYNIVLYATNKEPIGTLSFLVEDFIPPKVELNILNKPKVIVPNRQNIITAKANYLTKEPLPNAPVEIQRVIFKSKKAIKEYKDYHFGNIDEDFPNDYLEPINTTTNKDGNITVEFTPKYSYPTSSTLAMRFDLTLFEPGGRGITESFNIFYRNKDRYIGIKPKFKNDYIDLNANAIFNLIVLKNLMPTSANLEYKLIEQEEDYSWIYSNNSWEYNIEYSDLKLIKKGTISVNKDGKDLILDKLDWGSYKLIVTDNNGTSSSYRFFVGYWGEGGKKTPDRLPISINKTSFAPNDKLIVNIKPKFSGPVMINIANYHIFKTKTINAKEGKESQVEFKVDKSWGSSVYVLATAFRAQSKTMGATRAIGVAHFNITDKNRLLNLTLKHPKRVKSNSTLNVEVSLKNQKNKEVYITLSAVDKGILNLTKYKLPDPIKHFFGQIQLGIKIKDIYGDLIKAQGEHATFDTGAGDELDIDELEDKEVSNKRVIFAKMSKKTKLNNGKATIKFKIPNFQGSIQLHAIAWSKEALGSASSNLIVKDKISTELFMPLYLIKGDKATFTLKGSIDKEAPKGKYIFKIKSNELSFSPDKIIFNNSNKNSFIKKINVTTKKSADATILVEAFKDSKLLKSREFNITVKNLVPKLFTKELGVLKNSQTLNPKNIIQDANLTKFIAGYLKLSSNPLLPINIIKKELDNYSYRCAEQTASRAFPLINSKDAYDIQEVNEAIEKLLSIQHFKGGFSLWQNTKENLWISAYVLDFLTRANNKGFKVPPSAIKAGLSYLENSINRWSEDGATQEANIYALYVLARNNKILMSDINYFVNNTQSKVKSALAWGQLASTLKLVGKEQLAKELFNRAKEALNGNYYINYGGSLRDKASLVTLLSEAGYKDEATSLLVDLSLNLKKRQYLSTQEMSQIVRASNAISLKFKNLKLKIDNQILNLNAPYTLKTKDINNFKTITNISNGDVWYSLGFIGIPSIKDFNTIQNNGFEIEKNIYTLDGKIANLQNISQSDRFVVVISGKINNSAIKEPILIDFLPSGLEIENPMLSGVDECANLSWLKNLSTSIHKEYQDDRFVATFIPKNEFKFAYILRAVTIGEFALPPAKIEDMYQPRYRAFTKLSDKKIIIKKQKESSLQNQNSSSTNSYNTLTEQDYIDASTKPLLDLSKYSVYDLNYLRNGIFAYIGLDFSTSNPSLFNRFSKFSWYKPTIKSGAVAYSKLNSIQKQNVQKLLNQEKKLLDGLTLADFYRVNSKELDIKFLKRYSKEQLRVLRNSLIARYGYSFKDKKLAKIFKQFSWYKENKDITSSEIIDKKFNSLQRTNLFRIIEVEKSK